ARDRGARRGRSGRAHLVREPTPGRRTAIIFICLGGKVVLFAVLQCGEGVAGRITHIFDIGVVTAGLPVVELIAGHSQGGAGVPGQGDLAGLSIGGVGAEEKYYAQYD
ncbi:MAG: hypothetical protein MN733_43025, partial [Nitrososphaera sp.]|nr:hypothetical protein [Nitrososphaera sp.]